MTSYPACNRTSLSRKPCIADKVTMLKLPQSGSHGRSFRIHHEKNVRAAPPGGELTITSYNVGNTTSLSQKPFIADKKLIH